MSCGKNKMLIASRYILMSSKITQLKQLKFNISCEYQENSPRCSHQLDSPNLQDTYDRYPANDVRTAVLLFVILLS